MESNELIQDLQKVVVKYRQYKMRLWSPIIKKHNMKVLCEVGVQSGNSFEELLLNEPTLAVAVDIWKDDGVISRNDGGFTQEQLDTTYNKFLESVKDKPFVSVRRGYSFDVVKEFPDEYFDFIYIDADHSYEGCLRDIRDWYPKMKKGYAIVGDDFVKNYRAKYTGVRFGVVEAVQTFCKENNMEYFLIPGHAWGIIRK